MYGDCFIEDIEFWLGTFEEICDYYNEALHDEKCSAFKNNGNKIDAVFELRTK